MNTNPASHFKKKSVHLNGNLVRKVNSHGYAVGIQQKASRGRRFKLI